MKAFLPLLASLAQAPTLRVTGELDDALAHLDHMLEGLCEALRVEYYGPYVGVERRDAHRLVVREHVWQIDQARWSLKICSSAPAANWRAEWSIQNASRMRKPLIVRALPEFFCGFAAEIESQGKAQTPAGVRIAEIAQLFAPARGVVEA